MHGKAEVRTIPGVGIPTAMLARPDQFGGVRKNDLLWGNLVIVNGRAQRLEADDLSAGPDKIILPRLTETHVHLDKCHSIDRISNVGGDLEAALLAQRRDKARWTADDLSARAKRGVDELINAGVGLVRTHVDWSTAPEEPDVPLAWDVFGTLSEAAADRGMLLERAALTGIDEMADNQKAENVARHIAATGGAIGSFVKHHKNRRAGVSNLFKMADRFGLSLDFHVDEGLDPSLNGLDLIADVALSMKIEAPVLCGHACSLASQSDEDVARIADKLATAGIAVAALPTTNLYLQGRVRQGTPDRRGLTRFKELQSRGVRTVIGTDNVRDAFCPIGRHDPIHTLSLAVLAGHLDPPFGQHLRTITTDARAALGYDDLSVDGAAVESLLIFDCPNLSALIGGPVNPEVLDQRLETMHA